MAEKIRRSSSNSDGDMGTDYVLIATAIGAVLVTLVYLILI